MLKAWKTLLISRRLFAVGDN